MKMRWYKIPKPCRENVWFFSNYSFKLLYLYSTYWYFGCFQDPEFFLKAFHDQSSLLQEQITSGSKIYIDTQACQFVVWLVVLLCFRQNRAWGYTEEKVGVKLAPLMSVAAKITSSIGVIDNNNNLETLGSVEAIQFWLVATLITPNVGVSGQSDHPPTLRSVEAIPPTFRSVAQ